MFEYDVAISYSGEQRKEAEAIADCIRKAGVKVFYDKYEQANLWGKDLYEHLSSVYQKKARFCLMLVSAAYAQKVWTSHERRSAQARALSQKGEYLLPVRFDDTEIPGIPDTVAYLRFKDYGVPGVCALLLKKVGSTESVELNQGKALPAELQSNAASTGNSSPTPIAPRYVYPGGWFEMQGSLWKEYNPYGARYTFKELTRDSEYLYLFDESRSKDPGRPMYLRIPIIGGTVQWTFPNPVEWEDVMIVAPVWSERAALSEPFERRILEFLEKSFPRKLRLHELKAALPEYKSASSAEWIAALDALNLEGKLEVKFRRPGLAAANAEALCITELGRRYIKRSNG